MLADQYEKRQWANAVTDEHRAVLAGRGSLSHPSVVFDTGDITIDEIRAAAHAMKRTKAQSQTIYQMRFGNF